jgi:hypothetical protein
VGNEGFGGYLRGIAIGTAIGAMCIGLAVDVIDPFGLSPISISISNINTIKVGRNNHDRLVKPYYAARLRPKTIIMGTSRVKHTFNPALIRADFAPAYNAGVDALKMAEAKQLLGIYFRDNLPIEHLWLEVFPAQFRFDTWGKPRPVAGQNKLADMLDMTFSLAAIQESFATFRASFLKSDVAVQADGWEASGDVGHIGPNFVSPQFVAALKHFHPMPLQENAFADLDDIINMCAARGIDLKLFIGPIHPVMGYLYWATEREGLQQWFSRVSSKHDVVSFLTDAEFVEHELDRPKVYYTDSSHFSVRAAKIIMDDLAAFPVLRHGRVLNRDTASAIFRQWQDQLQDWTDLNPQYAELIRYILPNVATFPTRTVTSRPLPDLR